MSLSSLDLTVFVLHTFVDRLAMLFNNSPLADNSKKKLLIVRLDGIGDFILFLDTFKEYKKLYPDPEWEITLLGNTLWKDLAADLPYADNYIFINRKKFNRNLVYRYKILRIIRQAGFDVAIQPTYSREYSFGDAIIKASAATERIGNSGDGSNLISFQKKISDGWYTHLIKASAGKLPELEYNAEFIRRLGLREFKSASPIYPVGAIRSNLASRYSLDKPYFIISPGAAWAGRMWAPEKFALIARFLYEKTAWNPVLCAGEGERQIAESVISCDKDLPWENLAGKTDLSSLVKIVKGSKLIIANETGIVHLAAAVNCPNLCIIGGGHFGRFYPYGDIDKNRIAFKKMDCYGCNWECIYPTIRCIEEMGVKDVIRKVGEMLEEF
ncbi:glycosyltransferase family 9 protein [Candidatus Pacearchaeota archaeon]|nr:glycosyltransferase family 9 protein [Candidatus Pacearchaeota archaeon]